MRKRRAPSQACRAGESGQEKTTAAGGTRQGLTVQPERPPATHKTGRRRISYNGKATTPGKRLGRRLVRDANERHTGALIAYPAPSALVAQLGWSRRELRSVVSCGGETTLWVQISSFLRISREDMLTRVVLAHADTNLGGARLMPSSAAASPLFSEVGGMTTF